MTLLPTDKVCIDADGDEAHLCKWDGRELRVEHAAAADLTIGVSDGLRRLGLRPGFCLHYRVVRGEPDGEKTAQQMETLARDAGASAIRRLPLDIQADPGLTAARQAADRHRLGAVVCLEWRKASFQCAAVEGRGVVLAHDRAGTTDRNAICEILKRIQKEAMSRVGGDIQTLVCYGNGTTVASAADVAHRCGFRQVLIPDYAVSLAVVGMLIVDLVLNLRMEAAGLTVERRLREGFARLMDDAARQVTLEGYDIDDTVCERLVELPGAFVPLETLAPSASAIRALHLRVTIQTQKFALPSDGTGKLISI